MDTIVQDYIRLDVSGRGGEGRLGRQLQISSVTVESFACPSPTATTLPSQVRLMSGRSRCRTTGSIGRPLSAAQRREMTSENM